MFQDTASNSGMLPCRPGPRREFQDSSGMLTAGKGTTPSEPNPKTPHRAAPEMSLRAPFSLREYSLHRVQRVLRVGGAPGGGGPGGAGGGGPAPAGGGVAH